MATKLPPNFDRRWEAAKDNMFLTVARQVTDPDEARQWYDYYREDASRRTPFIDSFFRRIDADSRRHTLQILGEARFGLPPPDMLARLQAETDPETIDRWKDRVLTATSWQELLAR